MLAVGKLPAEGSAILRVERGGRPQVVVIDELAKYPVEGRKIVTNPRPAWRGIHVDYVTASRNFRDLVAAEPDRSAGLGIDHRRRRRQPGLARRAAPDMMISHVAGNRVASPRQFPDQVSGKDGPIKLRLADRAGDRPERVIPPDAS